MIVVSSAVGRPLVGVKRRGRNVEVTTWTRRVGGVSEPATIAPDEAREVARALLTAADEAES